MPTTRQLITPVVLGRTLKRLRGAVPVSQEGMAALAGIGRSYVGGIERGLRRPSFEKIDQLLLGMGYNWHDFADALDKELAAARRRDR
jgi:transcriptional regulator with XRE-family HTH domain